MKSKHDSEAMKLKHQVDTQKALVEQAKLENQKLKHQQDTNEYTMKIKRLDTEYKTINTENEAMKQALSKLSDAAQLEEIKTLTENITISKAKSMMMKKLNDERNLILQQELENACQVSQEMLDGQISNMKADIAINQQAIAKQMDAKLNRERKLKKRDYYHNTLMNKQLESEQLELDNDGLQQQLTSYSEESDRKEVKELIVKNVKQEMDNELLQERIKLHEDIKNKQLEIDSRDAKLGVLNSSDYEVILNDIYMKKNLSNQLDMMNINNEKMIETYNKYQKDLVKHQVSEIISNAVNSGSDVITALNESITANTEAGGKHDAERNKLIFEQLAAQNQTLSQINFERANIISRLRNIQASDGREAAALSVFKEKVAVNDIEELVDRNIETLRDFNNNFNQFLTTFH